MALTWIDRNKDEPIHVSLAAGTLTLSFGGRSNLSFDGEGRLVGAWFDGLTYRRALDNRVLLKWADAEQGGLRRRRLLDVDERKAILARAYDAARCVAEGLTQGTIDAGETPETMMSGVTVWLNNVAGWDWDRLEGEATRFAAIYKPVSILPPDQYLALVVQATEGCSYNECTFCTFYRDRPFRIKRDVEFREHVAEVQAFFGRGAAMRKRLFLADANAVIIPQHRLEPLLQIANDSFPILPQLLTADRQAVWRKQNPFHLDGIYAFISAPDALNKRAADFGAMRAQNVRRLYVGLESGHDPLRRFLRKQGNADDVQAAVEMIKAGGLSVGLIFMVGIGGERYRQAHFEDTVNLIKRLPLGDDDLLYISPFVAADDTPYVLDLAEAGIEPLSEEELMVEERRFKSRVAAVGQSTGRADLPLRHPRVSLLTTPLHGQRPQSSDSPRIGGKNVPGTVRPIGPCVGSMDRPRHVASRPHPGIPRSRAFGLSYHQHYNKL